MVRKSVKIPLWYLKIMTNIITRQLPIGAGHCQWDGLTDQNVIFRPLGPLAAA